MDVFWTILKIALSAYVGACLFVFLRQSRYVYYPDRNIEVTPESLGLWFDDVNVLSQDGETITGWFVPAGDYSGKPGEKRTTTGRTVLVCHGNGGDIGDRVCTVRKFHDMGFNVLIFDYRGYGLSSGRPCEKGTYLDALAMWNYLKAEKRIDARYICVYGQSLGGAIATWLAEQVQPGALIVESSFTSALELGARMFPYLPVRLFCTFRYDSLARMPNIRCPVLIANSHDDRTVPYEHGLRLFNAANEPKRFVEMGGGHNECGLEFDDSYVKTVAGFLATYVVADPVEREEAGVSPPSAQPPAVPPAGTAGVQCMLPL